MGIFDVLTHQIYKAVVECFLFSFQQNYLTLLDDEDHTLESLKIQDEQQLVIEGMKHTLFLRGEVITGYNIYLIQPCFQKKLGGCSKCKQKQTDDLQNSETLSLKKALKKSIEKGNTFKFSYFGKC